ncbi:hypothetical protein CC85DRAFT_117594 [Cutaneotrichosporon oleaginosum]|uniref:Uncharacterized protein n=1 Tax=Cutaneotrichosporon oleaginosum TaxID=879819 RepID=A0A0J0XXK9_9TREE|nr:uncharacterized protein CC85DRAFT_117594 [Cutaneotrichosporon oleaginosum]KLT45797.1 hypothetical protein CC85DRAFT_117594 [Cutaneotrichosporon oleaginosum]TXT04440.1 hypothetical protein COLE_07259 [Cutaneotrichosporon oleaginosum]
MWVPIGTDAVMNCRAPCDRDAWLSCGGCHVVGTCSHCSVVVVIRIVTTMGLSAAWPSLPPTSLRPTSACWRQGGCRRPQARPRQRFRRQPRRRWRWRGFVTERVEKAKRTCTVCRNANDTIGYSTSQELSADI